MTVSNHVEVWYIPAPPMYSYTRFQGRVHEGWAQTFHINDCELMGTNTMALIQACKIQAIMPVPKKLSFSAQLSNRNLATCWHIELSILGLHLSINIHLSNSFSCSIKFFLGRALGESCIACETTEKHSCTQRHASVGKLSLGKPATITFGENKDVNSSIKFRL